MCSEIQDVTAEQMRAAFPPKFTVVDWGSRPRGQGRRRGCMIQGAMSDPPQGKRYYLDRVAQFGLGGEEAEEIKLLTDAEYITYWKCRTARINHDETMDMIWAQDSKAEGTKP